MEPHLFARFWRAARGNVTVSAAFALFALSLACGAAVDYGRLNVARTQLTAAVDAAALQVGSSTLTDEAKMTALARAAVTRNFQQSRHGELDLVKATLKGNTVTVSAKANFRTSFMGMVGLNSIEIPASADVERSGRNIEVALILDTTGSMKGSRIDALKSAAKEFIQTVVWDNQKLIYSKAAVIPYSMGVNVGALAATVRGSVHTGTCTAPGCQYYKFKSQLKSNKTFAVSTCVSERIGPDAYTDVSPLISPLGFNYPSPNNPCLPYEIAPLTTDKTILNAAIDGLDGSGSTASQVGVAWGWYVLSRDFGIWTGEHVPAAYGDKTVNKIAIIMTDGEFNSSYCNGVIARSSTLGSGADDDKIDCDAPNGSAISQVAKLCAAMKAKGITIYTIGFDIENLDIVKQTLSNCASGTPNAYLAATQAQLASVFALIGKRVTGLRLAR